MNSPYLVPVAKLLRDVPSSLHVRFEAPFDALGEFEPRAAVETDVPGDAIASVDVRLESFSGGLRVRGLVEAPWRGVCRRCSKDVDGRSRVRVNERFVDSRGPGDDETYLIEHDFADLAAMVHDAIFLDLPLAPLCREDCRGLCPQCGTDRNEAECDCVAPIDPRWATLDGLQLSDPDFDE